MALSINGERLIPARAFFHGPMETALAPDELLGEARLLLLPDGTRFGFAEFSRRAGDYAQAMALSVLHLDGAVIAGARIGLGGVEAVPRRVVAAEAVLEGEAPGSDVFEVAAAAAAAAIEPLQDPQTDAQYRRELTYAMVYRALMRACPPSGARG